MSFAALILSGVKSLANILVETSIARTMSMPSVSILSILVEERGLAMAMIIITRAAVRNMNGTCLSTDIAERPPAFQNFTSGTLR